MPPKRPRNATASGAWLLSRTCPSGRLFLQGRGQRAVQAQAPPGDTAWHFPTGPVSPAHVHLSPRALWFRIGAPTHPIQASCQWGSHPGPKPCHQIILGLQSWVCRDGVARGKHVCDPPRSRKQGRPSGSSFQPQLSWRERERAGGGYGTRPQACGGPVLAGAQVSSLRPPPRGREDTADGLARGTGDREQSHAAVFTRLALSLRRLTTQRWGPP